ncbi:MAG: GldG family protein [bacterium]|nr:GldG family protein [bacterium]
MNDRAKHRGLSAAETLIVVGIVVALNVVGFYVNKRIDMTETQQYVISKSTRKVMKELKDPVTVEVFMSHDLPTQLISFREQIKDKLQELAVASNGKFRVRYTDPADNEEEKARAEGLGVPQFDVQIIEEEQQNRQKVFFGLVMNYQDKSEAIPQLYQPEGIEYEVTSRLVRMGMKEKPRIALFIGPINLNQEQGPSYDGLHQVLGGSEGFYEVVDIDPSKDKKLPDNIQGVVLMGAFGMSDEMKYSVDQFLMNGGNVFIAFDPMMQTGQNTPGGMGDGYPSLPTIEDQLEKYGLKVNKKLVVDQESPAQAPMNAGFMTIQLPYPLWPKIGPAGISKEVAAIARLESVVLPYSAPLTDEAREGAIFTPLFYSTDKAFLMGSPFKLDPQQNWRFLATTSVEKGPFKLGYQVSGKIPSAYPDGPPRGAEGAASLFDESKHVKVSSGASTLVVIPSATAFNDNMLRIYRENALLLMNLGDMLAIGNALTDIRSSPVTARPLRKLTNAQSNTVRWSLVLGVPVLVVLLGMAVWAGRARKRQAIQRQYSGSGA